jgi:hypothetical protein
MKNQPQTDRSASTVDGGRASADQLALICATHRQDEPESFESDSDAAILAHVRNTLALPGEGGLGGFPVSDDGTAYAAALVAFLTPARA